MLSGFMTKHQKNLLDRARHTADQIQQEIDNLLATMGEKARNHEDAMIRIMGLEAAIANGDEDTELTDFILAHDNINIVKTLDDRGFQITVKTQYVPTTESIAQARDALRQGKGWLTARSQSKIKFEEMKALFKALFVDRILKLNFCASYNITLSTDVFRIPISGYNFDDEFCDYMPNPHINTHRCGGDYVTDWAVEVSQGDFLGMINTCVASAGSLNFGDGTVMREFMDRLYGIRGGNTKAIVLPDGRVVTPEDAIAWINAQKGE